MDTPERNQIGTPVSKFEESPFSNFINSLSPINPTKTIHVSQTFGSLSFTSPPSVFTSPHVSLQKDYKFLRRHLVSDLAKPQLPSDEVNKDPIAEEDTSAGNQSDGLADVQVRDEEGSGSEGSVKPIEDTSDCAAELPRELKYDSGSPRCKTVTSSGSETRSEADTSTTLVQFVQESSIRGSFQTELNSQEVNHNNEQEACDWQSLISGGSDLFIFDSPNVTETSKGSLQKSQQQEETNVFVSLLARFPTEQAYHLPNSLQVGSTGCNETHETTEHSTQPTEETELQQTDQPSENLEITSVNEFFSTDSGEKPGKQPFSNLHRGLRRRCLTFEMPRSKRSIDGVLFSSSLSSLQNEENPPSSNRQPITPRVESSRCTFSGIGLHLNALAAASKDSGISNKEMLSPTSQEHLMNSLACLRNDDGPAENEIENAEDSSQASVFAATEDLNSNSPKKKRRKFETIGEGESCKRCNCKKSKCLKLYCECFAAGVYCVEPCSCLACFNKPIHEDTVLATRKQIESRNPLAFAPKVIRTSDSAQELGEDTTRTPASARHKRGCNCKKSNCLKKYCECYQGGVGCSINCRCEGCKNAFGRKDGSTLTGTEVEMEKLQASEKSIMDRSSDVHGFHDDEDQNSEFAIPMTPSRLYRPSVPLATSSKGKPPRSSLGTIGSSSSGLHPVDGLGRSTFLRTQSRIEKHFQNVSVDEIPAVLQNSSPPSISLKKTLSPKSKRISPPHHANGQPLGLRSSRKLILQSIPAFPSLSPRR